VSMERLTSILGPAPSEDRGFLARLREERRRVVEGLTAWEKAPKKRGGRTPKTKEKKRDVLSLAKELAELRRKAEEKGLLKGKEARGE